MINNAKVCVCGGHIVTIRVAVAGGGGSGGGGGMAAVAVVACSGQHQGTLGD